jgi:dihydroorotase
VHHLWFSDKDYERLECYQMESCDKNRTRQEGLLRRCLTIELTSSPPTTHHILWRKSKTLFSIYVRCPNGSALNCMLEFYKQELISLEKIVEKCATILLSSIVWQTEDLSGKAISDLTLVDLNSQWTVAKENLLYKMWLVTIEGTTFNTKSNADFCKRKKLVYDHGQFNELGGNRLWH